MLKKKIKYVDYDDVEREEDFYFNISRAEIIEMSQSVEGGLENKIHKIIQTKDKKEIIKLFKEIILISYGEKSPDGKRFIKSDELREAFSQTEAYTELFMELSSNEEAAAAFVNGVLPKQVQ